MVASSRPDIIDPALLRPGRIDKHLYVDFPDQEARREIINIYGDKLVLDGVSKEDIVELTVDYTSADIVAWIKEVRIKMAHSILEDYKI